MVIIFELIIIAAMQSSLLFSADPVLPKVAVFCSADNKASQSFKALAQNLGKKLGQNNFGLITGGSKTGLMKEVTDGYLAAAPHTNNLYGIMPEVLKKYDAHHPGIAPAQLLWVDTMHKRLETFHELSDIIVILPGGFGTLHELMDFLVAKQFSLTKKPIILINYEQYWDNLLKLFQTMQDNNLLAQSHQNIFVVVQDEDECICAIQSAQQANFQELDSHYWEKDMRK